MILPIYLYGAEVLRRKAEEADLTKKDEILKLIADMKETLAHADGVGLAAPQVGVSQRILIVDGDPLKDTYPYLAGWRRTMINPVVTEESPSKCTYNEGCLSVPGIYADVTRPDAITVSYFNENFEQVTERLDKFACRMVEHELSHLEGNVFTDNVSPIRKKMLAKKLQNILKGKVHPRYNSRLR